MILGVRIAFLGQEQISVLANCVGRALQEVDLFPQTRFGWQSIVRVATSLLELHPDDLAGHLKELGQRGYRARQVLRWAYRGVSSVAGTMLAPSGRVTSSERCFLGGSCG